MDSLKGSFLVAETSLLDPNFRCAVVLILEHGEAGAYGVVVNRPSDSTGLPLMLYNGGPCPSPGLVMLHGHREWLGEPENLDDRDTDERQVADGIYIGDANCLNIAGKTVPGTTVRFRIFRNYSGWGPGQLEQEIAARAWMPQPANAELLFDTPADELWPLLRPRRLPEPSLN
jgi:putative transcriptional regulator